MRTHSAHATLPSQLPASEREGEHHTCREWGLVKTSGNTDSMCLPVLCFVFKPALP